MSKAFTKGETATHVAAWDNKGTWTFRTVTVRSCGNKRMHLTDATTGDDLGSDFAPSIMTGDEIGRQCNPHGTVKLLDDAAARALCLEMAARHIADERARIDARNDWDAAYKAVKHAALHAPRAIDRNSDAEIAAERLLRAGGLS